MSIFTFSTNAFGKQKEGLGRSDAGFVLRVMRWNEGETMTMSGGVVVHALCEGNDVTGFYDHSVVT